MNPLDKEVQDRCGNGRNTACVAATIHARTTQPKYRTIRVAGPPDHPYRGHRGERA